MSYRPSPAQLAEMKRANGGHSFYSPSGSYSWLTCSGSLLAAIGAADEAGEDAAYGTVAHDLGERWLNAIVAEHGNSFDGSDYENLIDACEPRDLMETVVKVERREREGFEITRDADMFAYVREYVVWCLAVPGEHYVEQRVDFSQLTPVEDQTGTADELACEWQKLTVTDLKMGKGVRVYAADDLKNPASLVEHDGRVIFNGNPQLMIYALGCFYEWDWLYNFQEIVIRICQPRLEVFETWRTTREELLRFAEFVRDRAAAAWEIGAPRTPSHKGCTWCRIRANCEARVAWWNDLMGSRFDDITVDEDGVIEGVSYTVVEQKQAVDKVEQGDLAEPVAQPDRLATIVLEKLLLHRKAVERWFNDIEAELENRANNGDELHIFKLVESRGARRQVIDEAAAVKLAIKRGLTREECYKTELRSPAQLEEALHAKLEISMAKAKKLLAPVVVKPAGRQTLALNNDRREAISAPGSVFDDL